MGLGVKRALFGLWAVVGGMAILVFWLSQPFVIARPTIAVLRVDPGQLKRHVEMLSQTFHPRSVEHHAKLRAAGDYVHQSLVRSGGRIEVQAYEVDGRSYRNYSAHFGPAAGARLVIGAHYDSFEDTPGADDNASGVAGLIELARLLGTNPPLRPVELVAFTLEEPPYFRTVDMGSARHVRKLTTEGVTIRLMISLEMIGYFSDTPGSQDYPLPGLGLIYPSVGNFIAVVGAFDDPFSTRRVKAALRSGTTLPVYSINAPALLHGVDFSDHLNYWAAGVPAVMITNTSFMRNRNYHEPTDTAQTLDYLRMAEVVHGVYALAHATED